VITRTARRLRQEAGAGLTPSQTAALATIARQGPLTPSALAEAERIQRPSATRIVGKLADTGLVQLSPDPADGRGRLVAVSAAGDAELRRLRSRKNAYLAERLAGLDAAELQTLDDAATILERLIGEPR
jgi:DNA-binding MarR family transcriptional regulator